MLIRILAFNAIDEAKEWVIGLALTSIKNVIAIESNGDRYALMADYCGWMEEEKWSAVYPPFDPFSFDRVTDGFMPALFALGKFGEPIRPLASLDEMREEPLTLMAVPDCFYQHMPADNFYETADELKEANEKNEKKIEEINQAMRLTMLN